MCRVGEKKINGKTNVSFKIVQHILAKGCEQRDELQAKGVSAISQVITNYSHNSLCLLPSWYFLLGLIKPSAMRELG